jgi:hypothetical protein
LWQAALIAHSGVNGSCDDPRSSPTPLLGTFIISHHSLSTLPLTSFAAVNSTLVLYAGTLPLNHRRCTFRPTMASNNSSPTEESEVTDEKILIQAFLRNQAPGYAVDLPSIEDIDIRKLSPDVRQAMTSEERTLICADGEPIIATMRPMVAISSIKARNLLKNGLVKLPADVHTNGVTYLFEYLHRVLFLTIPAYRMNSNHINIKQMLSVTAIAMILGMEK